MEPLAWLTIAICVIRAEKDDEPRWWLAAGAIGGIRVSRQIYRRALPGLDRARRSSPHRSAALLARWQPWAGVLIAIVIAAPNLLWQAANGWPFVAHIAVLAAEKNIPFSPFSFLVQEILALGPASAPVWGRGPRGFRLLPAFCAAVPVGRRELGLPDRRRAAIGHARPYYLAPAYPLLIAGGAIALEAWLPRLAKPAFVAFVLAAGAVTAPLRHARCCRSKVSSPFNNGSELSPAPASG